MTANINRTFNSQRFRDIYIEGADASNQIALPEIQQRNFLFDWNLSLSQNLSNSLRLIFQLQIIVLLKIILKLILVGIRWLIKS